MDRTNNTSETNSVAGPADDFIIGDKVLLGDKPGVIAYLGEVKFASGEFAGVVLDGSFGKNDGSMQGVRYFQCDANRGVFVRTSKLKRNTAYENRRSILSPSPSTLRNRRESSSSSQSSIGQGKKAGPLSLSNSSLNSSDKYQSCIPVLTRNTGTTRNSLKVGDRVMVNGSKTGTLRFLGSTEFAQGEWAGVELDEPMGKNDGTVSSVRYFQCKDKYGLFAPVHKVAKITGTTTPTSAQKLSNRASPTSAMHLKSRSPSSPLLTRKYNRHPSQDSLTSQASNGSSLRVQRRSFIPVLSRGTSNSSPVNTDALQKALKEKEEHIEQLLRERESDRADMDKATNNPDEDCAQRLFETEEQLAKIQEDYESLLKSTQQKIKEFQHQVDKLETEKKDLNDVLSEQKMKIEDLQFQLEEEAMTKEDNNDNRSKELKLIEKKQKELEEERKKKEQIEKQMLTLKAELEICQKEAKANEESALSYLDQIDELTHKLSTAEKQLSINVHSSEPQDLNTVIAAQLRDIEQLRLENSKLNETVTELKNKLENSDRISEELLNELELNKTNQDILTSQLNELRKDINDNSELAVEINKVKIQLTDAEAMLAKNLSDKEKLTEEKKKTEDQLASLQITCSQQEIFTSQQFTQLREQLTKAERKLEVSQQNCLDLKVNLKLQEEMNKMIIKQNEINLANIKDENRKEIDRITSNNLTLLEKKQKESEVQIKQAEIIHEHEVKRIELEYSLQIERLQHQMESFQTSLDRVDSGKQVINGHTHNSTPCIHCKRLQEELRKYKMLLNEKDMELEQKSLNGQQEVNSLMQQIQIANQEKSQLEVSLHAKSQVVEVLKQQVKDTQDRLALWQQEVKVQIESNKLHSEKDLDSLKQELLSSQALLMQLERKLSLAEDQKLRLQQKVNSLMEELNQANQGFGITKNESNAYRGTNDVLFNQLNRQVEVMELSLQRSNEENLVIKKENDQLTAELLFLKQELSRILKREEITKEMLTKQLNVTKQKLASKSSPQSDQDGIRILSPSDLNDLNLIGHLQKALRDSEAKQAEQESQINDMLIKMEELEKCLSMYGEAGKKWMASCMVHIDD